MLQREEIEARRAELMARLSELDSRLHAIESKLETPRSRDWEDAAVDRQADEVLEGLGQVEQAEVARIRAALQRIRAGEYGICVRCGAEIAPERLRTLPATPFCRHCAAEVQ